MEFYSSANSNQTAAFFRLVDAMKRAKQNNRPFCIFIGAGCSLSSSLSHSITTEQIIKECLKKISPNDYQPPNEWEKLYKDFVNNVWNCMAFEDRRELLYEFFKDLAPSTGYNYLKKLIVNGYIKLIITTNFDMLIDDVLNDIPHDVHVSNLPVRKIKSGSDIVLLKVHGDIENGKLRFAPDELLRLPDDISTQIEDLTRNGCLVCGYRGQDIGVMSSLSTSTNYAAFWASPNRPLESDYFETKNIYKWMRSRLSEENFIYGDILGTFDGLMKKLAETLIGLEDSSFLPSYWGNSVIADSLQVNQKIVNIFCNLINCSEEVSRSFDWQPLYPFYAENYQNVLNAYLFFYRAKISNIPNVLKLPENEVESLLIGLAIEIAARTAGLSITACKYADLLKEAYSAHNYHCAPDKSFWDALNLVLLSMNKELENNIWESLDFIKLNMNNGGRFSLDVKKPMLQRIASVLNALNLCGILCPTSKKIDLTDIKIRYKKLLEAKSHHIDEEDGHLVVHLDDMTSQEYDNIYSIFFKNHQSILSGNAFILKPALIQERNFLESSNVSHSINISEYIVEKSQKITEFYLKLQTAFEFDSNQYVKTPTEDAIENFMDSQKSGMFLIGSSGSGKTKTVQHFCREYSDRYIIAATAPKCGFNIHNSGIGLFFDDIIYNNTYTQSELMKNINDVLKTTSRKLVLIYDGLNEITNDTNKCIIYYKALLELMEIISANKFDRCKVIVTCRDLAFLDYCENSGIFPTPEFCYCNTDCKTAVPYYQIPPLTIDLQIDFCNLYIKDKVKRNAFISDLQNNGFIQSSFTHPYLIAIAGDCYNEMHNDGTLLIYNVFAKFTRQMLKRLTFKGDDVLAQKIINTYCSLLISSQCNNSNITTFLILGSDGIYQDRDNYSRVLKELQDINLFTKETSTDSIRISHDRIEEYMLSNFLYYSLNQKSTVSDVVALSTTDSIFSCSLQAYFDRCLINKQFEIILDNLLMWYNINPHIIPSTFVCALKHLDELDLQKLMNCILSKTHDAQQIIEIILLGLKHAISFGYRDYPCRVFETLNIAASTNTMISKYRSYWNYIASKYYSKSQNEYEKAIYYCEEALKHCNDDADIYHIAMLQLNVLKSAYDNNSDVLRNFKDLYEQFVIKHQLEYTAECVLHWGSFLRQCSKFEEALDVYNLLKLELLVDFPTLQSALYRKIGTAHKNIIQRIIRKYKNEQNHPTKKDLCKMKEHYQIAISSFESAKKNLKYRINVEMLTLLSEITETAIIVIPFMPEQRIFADVYISEEAKLLSFIPIPEHEILYMRNAARISEIEQRYSDAINTLVAAKAYAFDETMSFRLFEINYQICRLTMRQWDKLTDNERKIGLQSLEDAMNYPLDKDNEYRKVLLSTQNSIREKLQQT